MTALILHLPVPDPLYAATAQQMNEYGQGGIVGKCSLAGRHTETVSPVRMYGLYGAGSNPALDHPRFPQGDDRPGLSYLELAERNGLGLLGSNPASRTVLPVITVGADPFLTFYELGRMSWGAMMYYLTQWVEHAKNV